MFPRRIITAARVAAAKAIIVEPARKLVIIKGLL